MNLGRAGLSLVAGVALTGVWTGMASAQGFQLDQFRAAETSNDGFALSTPSSLGHLDVGVRLSADYALDPLVYETSLGDAGTERRSIVQHMLTGNLGLAIGLFDHIVVYAGLPVTLWSEGQGAAAMLASADGTVVGDPYLGVRVRLFGEAEDVFALGLQLGLTFPLAEAVTPAQQFSGERGVTFLPRLMGQIRLLDRALRINLNVGGRVREPSELGASLRVGHELTYGVGVVVRVVPELDLIAELYGATAFETFANRGGFFGRESSPLEAIGGVRIHPSCEWEIGLAGGAGIARGYGTPDVRGVLQLGYAHDPSCRTGPTGASGESADPRPTSSGEDDADGDGIVGASDRCPAQAEDVDGHADDDGCPDPDNDGDGVLDVDDAAPLEPEDRDGFEDADGRPDPDNDGDGVADAQDGDPSAPEDRDGYEDEDGSPDPDNDRDAILDGDDACPLAPGRAEERGCPRTIRLDTATGTIFILERVEFATNSDEILDRSFPILEEVRAVLAANAQLARVRIEGHTDDRGIDAQNLDLSRRRAHSVQRWLTEHQVSASRLEAWGCGEVLPVETNRTAAGRQANRRVEFHIVNPAPSTGARHPEGCLEASE